MTLEEEEEGLMINRDGDEQSRPGRCTAAPLPSRKKMVSVKLASWAGEGVARHLPTRHP